MDVQPIATTQAPYPNTLWLDHQGFPRARFSQPMHRIPERKLHAIVLQSASMTRSQGMLVLLASIVPEQNLHGCGILETGHSRSQPHAVGATVITRYIHPGLRPDHPDPQRAILEDQIHGAP